MNKEKHLVLIDGKEKTEEIEKLEQTEKYYLIKFYNANKTYKYNFSKVVIENTTQQIELKDNQIVMIDNIIISNVTKIIKYISKIRIIFSDSREKLTDINKIKLLENNNKSSEKEILNYFKELSKYAKIVDEKTGEERYLLEKQYNKFTVPEKSVLKYYLNGINTEGQLKETAKYLGVSYWLVGQMVRKNEIPHFRVGGRILFRKKSIDDYMEQQEKIAFDKLYASKK